ncbi:GMP reductase 2-like [Carcharodon carcharias]|uniref:GMP reductase 2-like n=1 Tax=Carcharodon carcharias TaxID=13397 RepID=UPI001B7DBDA2|nr:GMP reductase 2-like [Carcharodon carcharias]
MFKFSLFTAIHKHYTLEQWKEFALDNPDCLQNIAASAGTGPSDLEKLTAILELLPDIRYICLDVANGYSEHFVELVKAVRKRFPDHTIMAGNVVTGEMVEELILAGADIIKVGIGPGSVCTTRIKTGVGYPQLSAVIECADAAHGLKGHIMSDGGCTCPGDVAKAFGAGADFVMLGGMFSGHSQCGGDTIEKDGKKYKLFYGMSSETAMEKHAGGVADYSMIRTEESRQSLPAPAQPADLGAPHNFSPWAVQATIRSAMNGAGADFVMLGGMFSGHSQCGGDTIEKDGKKYKLFYGMSSETAMEKHAGGVADYRASEGKSVEVEFKGDVESTVRDILGGVRSTCTYVGAAKLKELSRRTTFIRVTQQLNPLFN